MTGNNNSNTTNVNVAETIVVTRHPTLIDYLREIGGVHGRRVVGVLPLHLAVEAAEVVNVAINPPIELRGVELSLAQVRQYATPPAVYRVERIG